MAILKRDVQPRGNRASGNRSARGSRGSSGRRTGGGGGRRAPQKSSSLPLVIALGLASTSALSGAGYLLYQDSQTIKPDQIGCYIQPDQANTVMLVDSSEPRMDDSQGRDFRAFLGGFYNRTAQANEKFQAINTEVGNIGSIPAPVIETCVPASTNADLERLGAPTTTQDYLTRNKQKVFDETLLPAITAMTDRNPAQAQKYESPILEQIQSISRMPELQNGRGVRRLQIVSDMVQSTQDIQFCRTQGHLPRFEKFKDGQHFQRLKPHSLTGVDVTVLMLIRPGYGQFCKDEQEVRTWWEAYFQDAGAQSVEFIRLRYNASGV